MFAWTVLDVFAMETALLLFSQSSETCPTLRRVISLNKTEELMSTEIFDLTELSEQCKKNISPTSTAVLMNRAFNTVHLRSCEIYQDQLIINSKIGEGQFGLVYKGSWKGQACAIKKLKAEVKTDSVQYQRLLIELTILAGVGAHPNIVGFFGACIHDIGSPLIVEELVDGTNLEQYLDGKSIGFNLGRAKVNAYIPRAHTPLLQDKK